MVIDGKDIAEQILSKLKASKKPTDFFAGVVVGRDPAALSFQKLKQRTAMRLGLDYRIYELDENLGNDELRQEIGRIAEQKRCGAVVVQLPLPAQINKNYVLNAIPREKDPDVLSERSLGAFYADRSQVLHPAAATVKEILCRTGFDLQGKKAAVVGRGFLVGRPVATWLMSRAGEVITMGQGSDLNDLREADLVVLGAGKASLVGSDQLKRGAAVIDFGYSEDEETGRKLAGDLAVDESLDKLLFYTPTPGGTGPILVAKLFENFYRLQGALDEQGVRATIDE